MYVNDFNIKVVMQKKKKKINNTLFGKIQENIKFTKIFYQRIQKLTEIWKTMQ